MQNQIQVRYDDDYDKILLMFHIVQKRQGMEAFVVDVFEAMTDVKVIEESSIHKVYSFKQHASEGFITINYTGATIFINKNDRHSDISIFLTSDEAKEIASSLDKALVKQKANALLATQQAIRKKLPPEMVAKTASFLTNLEGTTRQQALQLRERVMRPFGAPGVGRQNVPPPPPQENDDLPNLAPAGGKHRKTRRRKNGKK